MNADEEDVLSTEPHLHDFRAPRSGQALTAADLQSARDAGGDAAEDVSQATIHSAHRPSLAGDELWRLIMGERRREDYEPGSVALMRQAWEQGYDEYW